MGDAAEFRFIRLPYLRQREFIRMPWDFHRDEDTKKGEGYGMHPIPFDRLAWF